MHEGRIAVAIAVAAAVPCPIRAAHAQPAPVAASIPEGFEHVDVRDVTVTLRDDRFSTMLVDDADPNTAFLGTTEGRFYKTTDGGLTWTESIVISQQSRLWATPESSVFFGGIRSAGSSSGMLDLIGDRPSPVAVGGVPGELPRLPVLVQPGNPLGGESAISAAGAADSLGVGLSARSPRLSMLTATRGRGSPSLSRGKLLADRSFRGTQINNIAVHPTDRKLMFAATANGLYKSQNGGETWARSFAGMTLGERIAARIAIRPGTPKLMILGTSDGAYTSTDDGESWSKLTTVGGYVNDVAFDLEDRNYVYLATNGGLLRSSDGGRSFTQIYYSTFPAESDVRSIAIDPFDADTAYIGADQGAQVTHALRAGTLADWTPLPGVLSALTVATVAACSRHEGHVYALVRARLHTINYYGSPPESAVIESWDAGRTWRQLFTGQSDGKAEAMAIDPRDPDQLWAAWTSAVHRITRATPSEATEARSYAAEPRPELGDVMLATLRHHDLELDEYTDKISRDKRWMFLPRAFTVTGVARQWSAGGVQDDLQFGPDRYFQVADAREWQVMAWASWSLPDFIYSKDSVPMLRQRVAILNDELRRRLSETVRRSYGELLRIQALLAVEKLELKTRVIYRLRIEQLEAVVDLASGGYLTRWRKRYRRTTK